MEAAWCVVLFAIDLIVAKTVYNHALFHYQCLTDENCTKVVSNSICINNECICQLGFKYDGVSQCIYQRRSRRDINYGIQMLGEQCESNDECRRTPVDGTKVCSENQCKCSPGHIPIDAYRCIRDFEPILANAQTTKPSPIEEFPGYGSMCTTHKNCQQATLLLECFRGTCVCLEGYVPLGKYLCYNIQGHDAPVVESSTSTTTYSTAKSTFISPHHEMVEFLGKLGSTCTNDYYCTRSVSRSRCYNGICSCIPGYILLDPYTCTEDRNTDLPTSVSSYKSLLEGKCKTNRNCQTPDAICLNNICRCPRGYFAIDSWSCLQDPDASSEEENQYTTTITTTTPTTTTISTTAFLWWPWAPATTTRQPMMNLKNTFPFRCLLNRQCSTVDRNSHCTSFGRCVCNKGYRLEMTKKGQRCTRKRTLDIDCD